MGWPSAQAPPFTLTLSCARPSSLHRDHRDIGEGLVDLEQIDILLCSSRPSSAPFRWRRRVRLVNQRGSRALLACATMRAIGFSPRSFATSARASTSAAAPSEIEEEFAAVTVPSFAKAGFSVGILAGSALLRLLVFADLNLAALGRDLHGHDLVGERTIAFARAWRASSDSVAIGVLIGAGELVVLRGILGIGRPSALCS